MEKRGVEKDLCSGCGDDLSTRTVVVRNSDGASWCRRCWADWQADLNEHERAD